MTDPERVRSRSAGAGVLLVLCFGLALGIDPGLRLNVVLVVVVVLAGGYALLVRREPFVVAVVLAGLGTLLTTSPLTVVLLGAALLLTAGWRRGLKLRVGPPSRPVAWVAGLALGLGSAAVLLLWFRYLAPRYPRLHLPEIDGVVVPLGIVVVVVSVANAVAEEVVWRDLADTFLARSGWAGLAIAATALGFGLTHLRGFPEGWWGVALTAAFGVAAALLVRRYGSVWPAVLAHAIADAVIVAQLFG